MLHFRLFSLSEKAAVNLRAFVSPQMSAGINVKIILDQSNRRAIKQFLRVPSSLVYCTVVKVLPHYVSCLSHTSVSCLHVNAGCKYHCIPSIVCVHPQK